MPYADPEDQRDYQREWIAARREKWIAEHGPCVHCGSDDELEVDHVDPEKKVTHRVWSWSAERREAELTKCQVLCHDCHEKKTYGEEVGRWGHGDVRTYKAGCRCDECRKAGTAARKDHRQRALAEIRARQRQRWKRP